MRKNLTTLIAVGSVLAVLPDTRAIACPFCTATAQTLSEEKESADVVILARLAKPSLEPEPGPDALGGFGIVDPDTGRAQFEIQEILKGKDNLVAIENIEVIFFGPPVEGKSFWITGIGTGPIDWTTPIPLSDEAVEYVRELGALPAKGAERLKFFLEHLESEDPLLRQDSYDEFARAPYDDVIALEPHMNHDELVEWITDPNCGPSRRRLYLTMLGVCGNGADVPMLEQMILSDYRNVQPMVNTLVEASLAVGGPLSSVLIGEVVEADYRRKKLGLDAMIACYLKLAGPEVLDKIDDRFLRNSEAEYTHTYNTLMALRFHGEETEVIPRERLLQSVRLLLDHPDFGDQVIPDLARWEDWDILERLVTMFKEADARSFVRQPVVTYLVVASEQDGEIGPRATEALEELRELDADAVERAESLMQFGFLQRARPANSKTGDRSNYTRDGSPYEEDQPSNQSSETENGPLIPDPNDPQFTGMAKANDATHAGQPSETMVGAIGAGTTGTGTNGAATNGHGSSAAEDAADVAPHTGLIVGVPLLAGAFLMGLFWLILKSGAG